MSSCLSICLSVDVHPSPIVAAEILVEVVVAAAAVKAVMDPAVVK